MLVPETALRASSRAFDSRIYPEVRRLVGSESFPGIDNDPRVTIFLGDLPDVAGYVSSADSYPQAVHPYSNEREIVYINIHSHAPGTAQFLATLAHEFTHLVHWNVNSSEDSWVKEGLAQFVAFLLIPEAGLPSGTFSSHPHLQLTEWPESSNATEPMSAHYEAASWFLRYVEERFGRSTLSDMLSSGPRGAAAMDHVLQAHYAPSSFADVFRDWTTANLLGTTAVDGVRGYAAIGPSPPRPRQLRKDAVVSESVAQFGARYYELAAPDRVAVDFSGAPTVPTIQASPAAGLRFWHGGQADSSVATLTRRFDLRGAREPSLAFWIWHDIEALYDFVHVAASTDDGASWELVESPLMSRINPSGNGLGPGYTGRSGGGDRPQWVLDKVNLARYAGRVVLVRFSYITDDAILKEGVALDDIRIDEIGFWDGAEGATDEWVLRGWAVAGGELPQIWSLQAVERDGDRRRVIQIPVDFEGRARWVKPNQPVDRVVFVVSGLTPATFQRGNFRLQITVEPEAGSSPDR